MQRALSVVPGGCLLKVGTVKVEAGDEMLFVAENLQFSDKGLYLLLGPNGSGKTTFIKKLSKILIDHNLVTRSEVGHISAMSAYDRSIPIRGKHFFDLYVPDKKWPPEFELTFGHLKEKSIREMSSGEFQSLLLVAHLCSHKKIHLFDEPFSHLNPVWAKVFTDEIHKRSSSCVFLVICHHIEDFAGLNPKRLTISNKRLELS